MRAVIQRVRSATVDVGEERVASIGAGLLALVGVSRGDDESTARDLARKLVNLRVFEDGEGRMNRSLLEVRGGALVVSQFTLYGDCQKGRRPSYIGAAPGEEAKRWVARFAEKLLEAGVSPVATGRFGAMMDVELVNAGPMTLLLDTRSTG